MEMFATGLGWKELRTKTCRESEHLQRYFIACPSSLYLQEYEQHHSTSSCNSLHTCKQFKQRDTHIDTHGISAPWLPSKWFVSRDPSCSAGWNKSHQAGSDFLYVDRMPNVIWRLGEHRIGPNSAWLCDVILSLDESLAHSHTFVFTKNSQKRTLTHTLMHFDTQCLADILFLLCKVGAMSSNPFST